MQLLFVFRQAIVRRALLNLVTEARPAWPCVAAADGDEAQRCLAEGTFNLVFAGLADLGDAAAEWVRKIRSDHAAVKVVVLAPDAHQHSPVPLLQAGAQGFLDGSAPLDRILVGVLESIQAGAIHLVLTPACPLSTPASSDRTWLPGVHLTPRQQAVMGHLRAGRSVKEIARHLDLSPGTVKTHLSNMYSALGARNRIEAVTRAGGVLSG